MEKNQFQKSERVSIRRVVPNIPSMDMEKSRKFYEDFLGFVLAMDMEWIMTFVSPDNPTAQLSVVKTAEPIPSAQDITITVEVADVDHVHEKAVELGINIIYPLSTESFGVRRFGVKDPSGVLINVMSHHKKGDEKHG